jgi:autotransporter translocation and assembly factor TamB
MDILNALSVFCIYVVIALALCYAFLMGTASAFIGLDYFIKFIKSKLKG